MARIADKTGDWVDRADTEPRNGLRRRLSCRGGDGGSEVTICKARPALMIGDRVGRDEISGGARFARWEANVARADDPDTKVSMGVSIEVIRE